jgi:hypothetical protein
MSIKLTNQSTKDSDSAKTKALKRDFIFGNLAGVNVAGGINEETMAGAAGNGSAADGADAFSAGHAAASGYLANMRTNISTHDSYTLAAISSAATVSAVEDVIDDFLGGSHSEAMDVIVESWGNGADASGSDYADMAADMKAFADAQDAGTEAVETTASINTTASLGVSMSAGDGWTASTSGTINLGAGSVSGGTLSLTNGMMTVSVGKTAHASSSAVSGIHGMDVALDKNSADTQLQATMALGGATVQVDNEMDGDNLETKSQTVGIKGSYGTMTYGLGWQADGDLGLL